MKRFLTVAFLILATLVLVGATVTEGEPRNVRMGLDAQVAGDSLGFSLRWVAPQRTSRQTPVTGYAWELWVAATEATPWGTMTASGTTTEAVRDVTRNVAYVCDAAGTWYTARVRATGSFSSVAPWGVSTSTRVACDATPPGAPVVSLDTIAGDTATSPPDSLVFVPVELAHATWDPVTGGIRFSSLGDVAKLCAMAYRDGVGYLAPRAQNVATLDSLEVITTSSVVNVADAPPIDAACWYLSAVGNGAAPVHLCSTDCPATLAWIGLPHWMKWPFLISGLLFWAYGIWTDRRKKRVRSA